MRTQWQVALAVGWTVTALVTGLGDAGVARADHVAAYSSYNGPYYDPNSTRSVFGATAGDIVLPVICDPAPPYCYGGNPYGSNAFAFQFTALHSGVVEAVWVTLWNRDTWVGTDASARVSLLADAGDSPGSALGSWDLELTELVPWSYQIPNGDDALVLTKDLSYWVKVEPLNDLSAVSWYMSYRRDGNGVQFTSLQGSYYAGSITPAMAVYVLVPSPEPAATAAAIASIAPLAWLRARRRFGLRRRCH